MNSKESRRKPIQLKLQPWSHEQQAIHAISSQINNQFNSQYAQYHDDPLHAHTQLNTINTHEDSNMHTIHNINAHARQPKTTGKQQSTAQHSPKKYKTVDYVKKNQKNIHSYSLFSANYAALLSDDVDTFIPINPNINNINANNQYMRRPSINTTYIGYYDEEPFTVDSHTMVRSRVRARKDSGSGSYSGKAWSAENSRPKTTDVGLMRDKSKSRVKVKEMYKDGDYISMEQQFCDRTAYTVGNYHLQKVLKIKEKLRQKLKRNSEKRDNQRGIYLKGVIKIQQEQEKQKQKQRQNILDNNFSYPSKHNSYSPSKINSAYQSRKNSVNSMESNQKQRKRIDKWKQYMKMQSEQRQQRQKKSAQVASPNGRNKANKFFGVVGGSIYK